MTEVIKGAKGGSKKQRTPREAPDNLVSIAYARLLDLVSEGEVEGLVNGEASIYLDETPAGSGTFPGFRWEQRTGTQDQDYLQGFSQVENEVGLGIELRSDAPWTRSITNLDLSAVRINFSLPRLTRQNTSNGDANGYRVEYAIDVAVGTGPFEEVLKGAFDGKTNGGYERSVRVDLEGRPAGGWRVRVRRLTANSASSAISDTTNIKSITEIIDAKFRYPNSALVGVSFDAETFGGSVPKRGYHMRGRIIRVPSNYDHATRTYTGIWDGTFKPAYSNNPAWVYYDLLLHPRYGLGDRVDASQVDKWSLYQIAQYCDQLVSDGMGGMEPRFTCNLYLQKQVDAYKALQDIAAIFRGITYWGAGQAVVSADMPADPVYTYTNGNVIGGKFNYKGSKRSTRYSAVLVSWNDPTDMYRAKVEYVQDDDAVARFGVQKADIMALGCTSQGQAQRAGKWALLTNLLETETVSFSVGLDGIRARPGQIIRVADNDRAGRRIGGRVSSATRSVIAVDKIEGAQIGDELTCILPTGEAQLRNITGIDGNQITVSPQFDAAPVAHSVWAWESQTLAAQRYRIVSISESGPLEYAITASKYVEGKHQAVDTGAIISQRPITSIPSSVQAVPENIRAISTTMLDQTMAVTTMTIMWDAAEGATRYDVEWRRGDGAWVYAGRTGSTELDVVGIYSGTYQIRVRAMNSLDIASPWAYSDSIELAGKEGMPAAPAYIDAVSIIFGIELRWGFPAGAEDTLRTEIQYNVAPSEQNAMHLGDYAYPADSHTMTGLKAAQVFYFRARLVDRTGNIGPWSDWVMGQSSADADEILDYIAGQISETELAQHLREEIELISSGGPGSVNERIDDVAGQVGADLTGINGRVDELRGDLQINVDGLNDVIDGVDSRLTGRIENVGSDISGLNASISDLYGQVAGLDDGLQGSVADLNSQLSQLETQLTDITGAEDWVADQVHLAGSLVRFDGALYRAEQDAPAGTPVTNEVYWRKVGDYASIGEAVAALSVQITDMQVEVDEITGAQSANVERLDTLVASTRGQRADGEKADSLRGWETQASITQRDRVEATDKEALAERLLLIDAEVGDTSAQLSSLEQAFASETEATAGRLDQLAVELGTTTAGLQQEIQTRVTETGALARDVQAMQAALEGVASSEAFDALVVEVEQLGDDITGVAQSVTSLTGRITNTETGMGVISNAVEGLKTTVNQIGEDLSAASESITSLGVSLGEAAELAEQADGKADDALEGLGDKADSTAVQSLTTEVERIGEDLSAASESITSLGSDLSTVGDLAEQADGKADDALLGLGGKADATAVQSLTTEVEKIGEDVTASSESITKLEGRLESAETGIEGNADAVESLTTEVELIDGKVTAVTERASKLSAELRPERADGEKADSLRGWKSQASITESSRVSASEREVLAERLFAAEVQMGEANAQLSILEKAFADESEATASQLTSLASELGSTSSALSQEISTRATETAALAQDIQAMQAELEGVATSEALAVLRAEVEEVEGRVTSSAQDIVSLSTSLGTVEQTAEAAQTAAQSASDLAGGKGRVFFQASAPAPAERLAQNLWIDTTSGSNTPKRWDGSKWTAVTDKVATGAAAAAAAAQTTANSGVTKAEAAQNAAQAASNLAGGKGKVFFQSTTPAVEERLPQNLWIDTTAGNNTPKRWDGSKWAAVTDKVATDAAEAAQSALDGLSSKADSSAVQELSSTVTEQGDTIISQGEAITKLTGRVEDAETGIDGNAEAVESLTTDVELIDGKLTAVAEQTSRLSADLRPTRADGEKADALRGYQSQASIVETRRVTATEAEASAERDLLLQAELAQANAALLVEQQTRATADSALAEQAVSMRARLDDAEVTIGQVDTASVNRDQALGQRTTTIEARMPVGNGALATGAAVQQVLEAVTDESSARGLAIQTVQATVSEAQSTADSKGKNIIQSAEPEVADRLPQNIWFDTTGGTSTAKRWDGETWVVLTDKAATEAMVAAADAQEAADIAQAAADEAGQLAETKGKVMFRTDEPAVADRQPQNLWFDITDGKSTPKQWDGESWVTLTDKAAAEAYAEAMEAKGVADDATTAAQDASNLAGSKGKVFSQDSAPAPAERLAQNLWIDTTDGANTPKRWDGLDWVAVTDKVATGAAAAVKVTSDAVADLEEGLSTMWSVKMQVNDNGEYVYAGIGLGIENGPGGLQSQFLIEADRFALLNTINGLTTTPFVVEGGQTIINSAVIKQADIVNLIVTGVLESPDYVPETSGIRLNFVTGEFEMNGSVTDQGRTTTTNRGTKVIDADGVVRVQIGDTRP